MLTIKKILRRSLFAILAFILPLTAIGQEMLVGTYNIRYKNKGDSLEGNVWSKRCQVICDQLGFMAPDVFGTQEVLHVQLCDMMERLGGYGCIGVGRDDGKTKGEYAAIFYRKDRLQLLDNGHFWLNETPDVPRIGWDAACIRICTWGKFRDCLTKKVFFFLNLHMDHVGKVARREGARLILSKIAEIAHGEPVVLTGDFNVDQTDEIYGILAKSGILKDSYTCAPIRFAENGTFNSFNPRQKTLSRIDHVFVSPLVDVKAYGMLSDNYWTAPDDGWNGNDAMEEHSLRNAVIRLPSDHYPVFVRICLP